MSFVSLLCSVFPNHVFYFNVKNKMNLIQIQPTEQSVFSFHIVVYNMVYYFFTKASLHDLFFNCCFLGGNFSYLMKYEYQIRNLFVVPENPFVEIKPYKTSRFNQMRFSLIVRDSSLWSIGLAFAESATETRCSFFNILIKHWFGRFKFKS